MRKIALITGATSGIGKAIAELFAEENIDLIICGRREERLEQLKENLEAKVNVCILSFDVRDKDTVFRSIESLPEEFKQIDILVNNAGNAYGIASIDKGELGDWDNMMDINVKGLLYVSRAVLPGMVERKKGHVINIGSIAAHKVYPNGNVYCASKHAVKAISEGMRVDLLEHGIKVTEIDPGAVETEFSIVRFNGDEEKAAQVYKGFKPLTARDVAETIVFAVTRPAHVNIAELIILPTAQASVTNIKKEL